MMKKLTALAAGVIAATVLAAVPAQAATYASTTTAYYPEFSASNTVATITGSVTPCPASGRPVSVNIVDAAGATVSWKAGTTTAANCTFSVSFPTDYVRYYRIWAGQTTVGANTYKGANAGTWGQIKSLRFSETFDTPMTGQQLLNTGKFWLNNTAYSDPSCVTGCSSHVRSDPSAFSVHDGVLDQRLVRSTDGDHADGTPRYYTSMLGLNVTNPSQPYGHFEARVAVSKYKGVNDSMFMWSGGYDGRPETVGQGEFDLYETSCCRTAGSDPGANASFNSTVYTNAPTYPNPNHDSWVPDECARIWERNAGTYPSCGQNTGMGMTSGWNSYHVYEGTWLSSGFTLKIDGVVAASFPASSLSYVPSAPMQYFFSTNSKDGQMQQDIATNLANGGDISDWFQLIDYVKVWS